MRVLSLVFSVLLATATAAEDRDVIYVTGEGDVAAAPDMATITMGVSHQADTAAQAMAQVAQDTQSVIDALTASDVQPRDMQTSGLNMNPVYDQSNDRKPGEAPVVVGFRVDTTLTVRIRELDDLGELLDAVVSDGANRFRGLSFGVQEPDPLVAEARHEAVLDGRLKAEMLAASAGVTLGNLIEMREGGGGGPRPVQMEADFAMARSAMPLAQGEVSYRVSVSMAYEIINE